MKLITSFFEFNRLLSNYEKDMALLKRSEEAMEESFLLDLLYISSAESAEIIRNSLVDYSSFSKLCKDFVSQLTTKDSNRQQQIKTFTKKIGDYSIALGIDDLPELFDYALTIYTQYHPRLVWSISLEELNTRFFKTSCSEETLVRYKQLSECIQKELDDAPIMDDIIASIDNLIRAKSPQTPAISTSSSLTSNKDEEEEIIYEEETNDSALDVKGKTKSTYVPIAVKSISEVGCSSTKQAKERDEDLKLAKKLSLMNIPKNHFSEDGESDSAEAPVTQRREHSTNNTSASAHLTKGTREHSSNNTSAAQLISGFFEPGNEEMCASYRQFLGALNKYAELYTHSLGTQQSSFFDYQSSSFNELHQLGETLLHLLKPENSLYSICKAHILSCLNLDPQNIEKHISNFSNRIAAFPVFKGDLNLIQLMNHTMYTYQAYLLDEPYNCEELAIGYAADSKEKLLQFKAIYEQLYKDFDKSEKVENTLIDIIVGIAFHEMDNARNAAAASKDIKESSSTPVTTSLANNRNRTFSYRIPPRDLSTDFWTKRPK